jgi:hypothetical protein
MVIKSLSRRDPASIGQLLGYISREGSNGAFLLHNLPLAAAMDLDAARAAFLANAAHLPERKNGIAYYHEILSLSGCDQPQATPAMLLDLAQHYLALRAPAALAYGRVHFEPGPQTNPHIHLAISANLCGQRKKLHLSKAAFRDVREALERYQQQRYPQLQHSLVSPERTPVRAGRGEQEARRRQGGGLPVKKQQLRDLFQEARLQATSERDFRFRLAAQGLEPYFRGGRLAGVAHDGKKYRLTTLGLADTYAADFQAWQALPGRLCALDDLALEKTRRHLREHGFAQALLAIVEQTGRLALPAAIKDRLAGLDVLLGSLPGRGGPTPD